MPKLFQIKNSQRIYILRGSEAIIKNGFSLPITLFILFITLLILTSMVTLFSRQMEFEHRWQMDYKQQIQISNKKTR
jgi:hypothetical protein